MAEMIQNIEIVFHRVTPLEAEVGVAVRVDAVSGAELRGRIRGPVCAGRETVQIAYPLRGQTQADGRLTARAAIPEPNLWSAEAPFSYEAVVEVWRGGNLVAGATHPFRLSLDAG